MSLLAAAWALKLRGLHPTRKIILASLGEWADDRGCVLLHDQELCQRVERSRSAVLDHVRALEALGLLTRTRQRDASGGNAPALITLHVGRVVPTDPLVRPAGQPLDVEANAAETQNVAPLSGPPDTPLVRPIGQPPCPAGRTTPRCSGSKGIEPQEASRAYAEEILTLGSKIYPPLPPLPLAKIDLGEAEPMPDSGVPVAPKGAAGTVRGGRPRLATPSELPDKALFDGLMAQWRKARREQLAAPAERVWIDMVPVHRSLAANWAASAIANRKRRPPALEKWLRDRGWEAASAAQATQAGYFVRRWLDEVARIETPEWLAWQEHVRQQLGRAPGWRMFEVWSSQFGAMGSWRRSKFPNGRSSADPPALADRTEAGMQRAG
jgi:hypothetical protein